jgi:autotransporter family porin
LPPGSALPTGAQCASRVRAAPEVRAVNQTQNNTRGTRANTLYPGVDGNFTGTTDQILQWVACKWGIDEDIVRAQIAKESWWKMSAVGDNGESFGLGQVRVPYHATAFVDDNAKRSSAYNLDYTYAVWRSCFEGKETWLNTVERGATYVAGDAEGCLGVWFTGRWRIPDALTYIAAVNDYRAQRIWETPSFING